jgi:hypothetical protein
VKNQENPRFRWGGTLTNNLLVLLVEGRDCVSFRKVMLGQYLPLLMGHSSEGKRHKESMYKKTQNNEL